MQTLPGTSATFYRIHPEFLVLETKAYIPTFTSTDCLGEIKI